MAVHSLSFGAFRSINHRLWWEYSEVTILGCDKSIRKVCVWNSSDVTSVATFFKN